MHYCDTTRFLVHIFRLFPTIILKISQKRYFHVSGSISIKKRMSLGEDSDLYLKTDVMLSADIFENLGILTRGGHELRNTKLNEPLFIRKGRSRM